MSKQALTREEKKFDDKIRGLERNYCIVKTVTIKILMLVL